MYYPNICPWWQIQTYQGNFNMATGFHKNLHQLLNKCTSSSANPLCFCWDYRVPPTNRILNYKASIWSTNRLLQIQYRYQIHIEAGRGQSITAQKTYLLATDFLNIHNIPNQKENVFRMCSQHRFTNCGKFFFLVTLY